MILEKDTRQTIIITLVAVLVCCILYLLVKADSLVWIVGILVLISAFLLLKDIRKYSDIAFHLRNGKIIYKNRETKKKFRIDSILRIEHVTEKTGFMDIEGPVTETLFKFFLKNGSELIINSENAGFEKHIDRLLSKTFHEYIKIDQSYSKEDTEFWQSNDEWKLNKVLYER